VTGPSRQRSVHEPSPELSEPTRAIGGGLSGVRVLVAHPGAELYGSDRVVLESVVAMTVAGATVDVTLPERGPLVARLERTGATVLLEPDLVLRKRVLRPRNWPSTTADAFRTIGASQRLLRRRPDLVYVNTITLPLWPLLARTRGIPVLTHIHEAEAGASPSMLRVLYAPHLPATAIIANSEFSRSIVARASVSLARRTRVIYNGVAGPVTAAPARASLEGRPVRLTYIGRLSPRKGTDLVITAAAELVDDGVDVEVDILGEVFEGYEWYAEALRNTVAERGLGSRVRFLGFRDDVWIALQLADIVVIPSPVGEPFGNTAVEAALAARPLVVSESSGLLEATDGLPGVHRVPPGDASAIADAVRDIIAHWPDHRARAEASARVAAMRFDPERYRGAIVDLVAALVNRSAPRPDRTGSDGAAHA
jgi:glycosyltransferase involved in cell wall biosynthesis